MLVDLSFKLPADPLNGHPDFKLIEAKSGPEGILIRVSHKGEPPCNVVYVERVQLGVYCAWNFHNTIDEYADHVTVMNIPSWDELIKSPEKMKEEMEIGWYGGYGSADTVEQILAWKDGAFVKSDRLFVLEINEVSREHTPGWRWEKNGSYIGTKSPQAECIGDEPEIVSVLNFSFHEVCKKGRLS